MPSGAASSRPSPKKASPSCAAIREGPTSMRRAAGPPRSRAAAGRSLEALGAQLGRHGADVLDRLLDAIAMRAERQHADARHEASSRRRAAQIDPAPGVDALDQTPIQSVELRS